MGNKASEQLINQKKEFLGNIQKIEKSLIECDSYSGDEEKKDEFLKNIDTIIAKTGKDYIKVIQNLNENNLEVGTSWLQSIVERTRKTVLKYLPSFI